MVSESSGGTNCARAPQEVGRQVGGSLSTRSGLLVADFYTIMRVGG